MEGGGAPRTTPGGRPNLAPTYEAWSIPIAPFRTTWRVACGVRVYGVAAERVRDFFFFFTLVTGPRMSFSLKLSDTRV